MRYRVDLAPIREEVLRKEGTGIHARRRGSVHDDRGHEVPVGSVRCFVGRPEGRPSEAGTLYSNASANLHDETGDSCAKKLASLLPLHAAMLKLLGSIAIARLLGFGILGFIVIYALLSLLS